MILWILLFITGNVLDYFTTYLGMRGLTKEEMNSKELNVLAASVIHNKKLTALWKGGLTACIIAILLANPEAYWAFKVITVFLFIVVLNNLYAYYAKSHGRTSPGNFLMEQLGFPKILAYLALVSIYWGIAAGFTYLVIP